MGSPTHRVLHGRLAAVLLAVALASGCELFTNTPPVANAGPDMSVNVGEMVQLDGTGADADGDDLTFAWSFTSVPAASSAALIGASSPSVRYTPDVGGQYRLSLEVSDGHESDTDECTVSVNSPPLANAGPDQTVDVGNVQLDGTASSDPDGDHLSYNWTLISRPGESSATIDNPSSGTPTLTTDMAGDYVVWLVVDDGIATSMPDEVRIKAIETRLFLNHSIATSGNYLSSQPATSGSTRITLYEAGQSIDFDAVLGHAIAGDTYGFSMWLGAGTSAGQTGMWEATLLIEHGGVETALASHTFAVPFNVNFLRYTGSVTGTPGGVQGDRIILRLTLNGASQGAVLFGAVPVDSYVRLPGQVTVSQSAVPLVVPVTGEFGAKVEVMAGRSRRYSGS